MNTMSTLFRAIVTGFGLRLGSEIAKAVSQKLSDRGATDPKRPEDEDEDDSLPTTSADPPTFDSN